MLTAGLALIAVWMFTSNKEVIILEHYNGVGGTVLEHGTVLSEQYQDPDSVSGRLDIEGVWIIRE